MNLSVVIIEIDSLTPQWGRQKGMPDNHGGYVIERHF